MGCVYPSIFSLLGHGLVISPKATVPVLGPNIAIALVVLVTIPFHDLLGPDAQQPAVVCK